MRDVSRWFGPSPTPGAPVLRLSGPWQVGIVVGWVSGILWETLLGQGSRRDLLGIVTNVGHLLSHCLQLRG